jgi:hypothetical protein
VLQLRLLQEAIKREEDSLAEEHRREIQARAEADEAAKVAYYEAKQRLREQRLQQVRCLALLAASVYCLSLAMLPVAAHTALHNSLTPVVEPCLQSYMHLAGLLQSCC